MDLFRNRVSGLESPGYDGKNLTPDDATDLAHVTRAVWVGVVGDIDVILASGETVNFKNASGWMPLRIKRLNETGTTAADIVGVW